jgi:hypothetical protein
MARLVSPSTLAQALLPAWQACWRQSLVHWSGAIALVVGEDTCTLRFDSTQLQRIESSESATMVRLSPQRFTQLVFGYRSIALTLQQRGQSPPDEVSLSSMSFSHTAIPGFHHLIGSEESSA